MGRLDMNTCQTSIKTDILFSVANCPWKLLLHLYGITAAPMFGSYNNQ